MDAAQHRETVPLPGIVFPSHADNFAPVPPSLLQRCRRAGRPRQRTAERRLRPAIPKSGTMCAKQPVRNFCRLSVEMSSRTTCCWHECKAKFYSLGRDKKNLSKHLNPNCSSRLYIGRGFAHGNANIERCH